MQACVSLKLCLYDIRVGSVGSAVISFLWGAFLCAYQQSGEERLNRLLCMANLLSSLNIEVEADLWDCQYSSSSGLCRASEPVKWKGRNQEAVTIQCLQTREANLFNIFQLRWRESFTAFGHVSCAALVTSLLMTACAASSLTDTRLLSLYPKAQEADVSLSLWQLDNDVTLSHLHYVRCPSCFSVNRPQIKPSFVVQRRGWCWTLMFVAWDVAEPSVSFEQLIKSSNNFYF